MEVFGMESVFKAREAPVAVAFLLVVCIMLAVWAIVTLVREGEFNAAGLTVFSKDPHADVAVFWLKLTYFASPFFSSVFGVVYAVLVTLLLRRSYEWVAVVAVLLSLPVAAMAV